MTVPTYEDLYNPLLLALHELGGCGSVSKLEAKVAEILKLTHEDITEIHRGKRTKLNYRLAWARNYLKRFGLLENSVKGIWSLTRLGQETRTVDKTTVGKIVRGLD